jgi:uncharacterized short protein YbdD (DUF466 family)
MSDLTYKPRTQVEIRLNQQSYRDISTLTGVPLAKVMQYGDQILKQSMFQTIQDMEVNINKYVPKATGQLRDSLTKQLHNSTVENNWLQMKLGTYVRYMKYVANMKEKNLQHPKLVKLKFPIYQRNSKHGKKGQAKRNPGIWRYVYYYGAPRWVKLDDPQAQENFYSQLIMYMKKRLEKHIAEEIRDLIPANQRRPYYNTLKVVRK